jgi:hypothetical protein
MSCVEIGANVMLAPRVYILDVGHKFDRRFIPASEQGYNISPRRGRGNNLWGAGWPWRNRGREQRRYAQCGPLCDRRRRSSISYQAPSPMTALAKSFVLLTGAPFVVSFPQIRRGERTVVISKGKAVNDG